MKNLYNIASSAKTAFFALFMITMASANADSGTRVHEEKFPNYFNTAFNTVINTVFPSASGTWEAWSNSINSTVVVVDYAQYSAPCAVKIVNYSNCAGLTTATARSTSPVINLAPHLTAGTLFMDFYVFSYEAVSSANSNINVEFYNGASGNWVKQWGLTGAQYNAQIGLNNWKKITLNIPAAYRRADFKYRIVGNMNAGVCGNQYIYFDDFGINSSLSLLPAAISVTAREEGSSNLVQWTNFNEGGNRDYTIERSADGRNFTSVGVLPAQSGTGLKSYSFTDRAPLSVINYYRVAVNTLAGSKVYSAIKVVSKKDKGVTMALFPNPVTDFANISLPVAWQQQPVQLQVVAADGRMMKNELRNQAAATEWVELHKLVSGAYRIVVRNTATGEMQAISFVKR